MVQLGRRVWRGVVGVAAAAVVVGGLVVVPAPASAADPCGPGSNPIECENSKPGENPSVWDIEGAGDPRIQGFATQMSVQPGETIDFKINSESSPYTIDIYRTGWYQGLGARHIASVTPSASLPQSQPACMTEDPTGLYDCGNWAVSASWAVPSDAVSGVYIALLESSDGASQITFVVRETDATASADVVFQTSDTTWQGYNTFGGSSFYQGYSSGSFAGETPAEPRGYKLSYNRPFATRGWESGRDFYFSSEFAMVRFLERNGYDVSYISGVDTARDGSLLLNHKVFLSVGHDEYWSGAQRANVQAARDAGVNLAFFSGNEIYWRTRWESSSASGTSTDYRTLVSYKETWSNAKIDYTTDPMTEEAVYTGWTGTWRDPRFATPAEGGGLPENALSGTLYTSNFTDLAVTVSAAEGKLRLWRGTDLVSLAPGTSQALAPHTVGYESDEAPDNGFRPAGQVFLSTTVGAVPEYLQDYGNVVATGTTTHHTTLYRAPSGALVFSAGSIQWAWGLDATHDGAGGPADARMQQATVNLLADMGAQPATLMAGLSPATASSDTTGPVVSIASPSAGAAVDNGAVVTVSGTAADTGGVVAGVEVSTDGGSTWHPASGTATWSYSYLQHGLGTTAIQVRGVDDSANIGAVSSVDVDVAGPASVFGQQVPAVADSGDASAVELGLKFSPDLDGFVTGVRFYKSAANTGTHTGTLWSSAGTVLAQVTFSGESASGWQTALFSTPVAVAAGQTYTVSYTAPAGHYAFADEALAYQDINAAPLRVPGGYPNPGGVYGNPGAFPTSTYGAPHYYVDALFSTVDTSPLTVGSFQPYAGATSVPVTTTVSATYSKPLATGTADLTLTQGTTPVAGAVTYDPTTRKVTFTPDADLAYATSYTVAVSGTDEIDQSVSGTSSWTFTTAAEGQVPGAATVSLYDDSAVPDVIDGADPDAVTLGMRFASTVAGTVDGVRFYKAPGNTGTHTGYLYRAGDQALLGTVTFTGESAAGWQTAMFDTPIAIAADTDYMVAYRAPSGHYSLTPDAFSGTGVQRAPLYTASNSGAYSYSDGYPGHLHLDQLLRRPAVHASGDPVGGHGAVAPVSAMSGWRRPRPSRSG